MIRGAGLLAAALLGACATEPVVLSGRYDAPARSTPQAAACRVALVGVTDERLDRKVVGSAGPRMVYAPPDAEAWIRSAFVSLDGPGGAVVAQGGDAGLELSLALVSASVRTLATSTATSIVIRAGYRRGGVVEREAVYRGDEASVNWTGSAAEIEGRMNIALGRVLQAARTDLDTFCRAAPG